MTIEQPQSQETTVSFTKTFNGSKIYGNVTTNADVHGDKAYCPTCHTPVRKIDYEECRNRENPQNNKGPNFTEPLLNSLAIEMDFMEAVKAGNKNGAIAFFGYANKGNAKLQHEASRNVENIQFEECSTCYRIYRFKVVMYHELNEPAKDYSLIDVYNRYGITKALKHKTSQAVLARVSNIHKTTPEKHVSYIEGLSDDLKHSPIVTITDNYQSEKYAEEVALAKADFEGKIAPIKAGIQGDLNKALKELYVESSNFPLGDVAKSIEDDMPDNSYYAQNKRDIERYIQEARTPHESAKDAMIS